MTTFVGVEAQAGHFDSYIQGVDFIEDSAIFKPCVNTKNMFKQTILKWPVVGHR